MTSPKKIAKEIKNRLNHPFLGSLTISFCLYNWKCWLFAFTGSIQPSERISAIALYLRENNPFFWQMPLLCAIAFVIGYPVLNVVINSFFHSMRVLEANMRDKLTERLDLGDKVHSEKVKNLIEFALNHVEKARQPQTPRGTAGEEYRRHLVEASTVLQQLRTFDRNVIRDCFNSTFPKS